jgi:hypothetical protein
MQNMIEQGLIKDVSMLVVDSPRAKCDIVQPIFTVKLDKHDSRGFYTFGYIDKTVHAGKLFWQPLVHDSDWWEGMYIVLFIFIRSSRGYVQFLLHISRSARIYTIEAGTTLLSWCVVEISYSTQFN